MCDNANFRCFLAPILLILFIVVTPSISWASVVLIPALEDAQEWVRQNPGDAEAHHKLDMPTMMSGNTMKPSPHKEAIRIKPDYAKTASRLGFVYWKPGQPSAHWHGAVLILVYLYFDESRKLDALGKRKKFIGFFPVTIENSNKICPRVTPQPEK